jgi:CRISPR-associated protein Cas6
MPAIDLLFPVLGTALPTDHSYPLYSALTRAVPEFHRDEIPLAFAPILGDRGAKGLIRLHAGSRLRVRLPADHIPRILPLAGKAMMIAGHRVRLGVPYVQALAPASALGARLVTFKHSLDASRFLEVSRQRLDAMGVNGKVDVPTIQSGSRLGQPRRRVVRIKGNRLIGFALRVIDLTPHESLVLQEQGLGGRRRMGCGFFLPLRVDERAASQGRSREGDVV